MNNTDFSCKRCYSTDEMGQITKYRCSRYGWSGLGYSRCRCEHHQGDISLAGSLLYANGIRIAEGDAA